jgi:uncharacterized protein YdhG (YjbR/CyaY superfamily)
VRAEDSLPLPRLPAIHLIRRPIDYGSRLSPRPAFLTVPEYLSTLEPAQARVLRRILALVRKSVPGSSRVIHYGIPAFKQDRVFIYCAAFRKHIGIYPPVRNDAKLVAMLKPYANAKGNLCFRLDKPIPLSLIARVVKALARQYARHDK